LQKHYILSLSACTGELLREMVSIPAYYIRGYGGAYCRCGSKVPLFSDLHTWR